MPSLKPWVSRRCFRERSGMWMKIRVKKIILGPVAEEILVPQKKLVETYSANIGDEQYCVQPDQRLEIAIQSMVNW